MLSTMFGGLGLENFRFRVRVWGRFRVRANSYVLGLILLGTQYSMLTVRHHKNHSISIYTS